MVEKLKKVNGRVGEKWTFKGREQSIAEWARELGITYKGLRSRVVKYGYTIEEALSQPKLSNDIRYYMGNAGERKWSHEMDSDVIISIETIQKSLRILKGSPKDDEKLWEIRVYEWILSQHESEKKAFQYLNARWPAPGKSLPKREVVKKLGWNIR